MLVKSKLEVDEAAPQMDGDCLPPVPSSLADTGIDCEFLRSHLLRSLCTTPRSSTESVAQRLCLSVQVAAELLDGLRKDHCIEVVGQTGPLNLQFAVTQRGLEQGRYFLQISRYVGPTPVNLDVYRHVLQEQLALLPAPNQAAVDKALSSLVLPKVAIRVAGTALCAGRPLLLYGAAGNGKSSIGYRLHQALSGSFWIPHCIEVDGTVIRVFDKQSHEIAATYHASSYDRRWVCIKRPLIVVGGEFDLSSLELTYSETQGFYQAPLHVKANGGLFLLDDLGCQQVHPTQLLNRWIYPLEHGNDFLTLRTGQQISLPFNELLVMSSNQLPEEVLSPALLRRLGYRLEVTSPTREIYEEIFRRLAISQNLDCSPDTLRGLWDRYARDSRVPRCCEPRDLIERAIDFCGYEGREPALTTETLEFAWQSYFG